MQLMVIVRLVFWILFIVSSKFSVAQNNIPLLDRKISVNFTNVRLKEALFDLSKLGQFNLSYNSEILPQNNHINFKCNQKIISEILPQILPSDLTYKTSGNSVVLIKKPNKIVKKNDIVINGCIYDSINKIHISEATILNVSGYESVISDSLGNFVLRFSQKHNELIINISKFGYNDTILLLQPLNQTLNINLSKNIVQYEEPIHRIEIKTLKSIENYPVSRIMIPEDLIINTINVAGYSKRKFQLSLTPGVSTNLKRSGLVKNEISINLIGGYNYGVGKFEIGGAFNLNRSNVFGFQVAGLGNLVGGSVNGLQLAGVLNRTKGNQNGVQVAGFGNFNSSKFTGLQLSSAVNFSSKVIGIQMSGGINVSDTLMGLQLTTIYNKTKILRGAQISAGLNVCETLNGIQIGIFNRAKQNNGFQIGIINYNNSSTGLSIGFLNFVKDKKFPRILFVYN